MESCGGYNFSLIKDDDIVFETFHHRNGEVYTCMYQARARFVMNSWANGVSYLYSIALKAQ